MRSLFNEENPCSSQKPTSVDMLDAFVCWLTTPVLLHCRRLWTNVPKSRRSHRYWSSAITAWIGLENSFALAESFTSKDGSLAIGCAFWMSWLNSSCHRSRLSRRSFSHFRADWACIFFIAPELGFKGPLPGFELLDGCLLFFLSEKPPWWHRVNACSKATAPTNVFFFFFFFFLFTI